jgi:hypothetical protein
VSIRDEVPYADAAADALMDVWRGWSRVVPGSSIEERDGIVAFTSGVAAPIFNGVWGLEPTPSREVVAASLDEFTANGIPHCLQVRPGDQAGLDELATARGMMSGSEPLMATDRIVRTPSIEELVIDQLASDLADYRVVVAAGFGMPDDVAAQLSLPSMADIPGARIYVGRANGVPVTVGIGVTCGTWVGVYSIATVADARRRGYGAAITARVVEDGFAAGARHALLQASELGFPVYERLGFRVLERWNVWTWMPSAPSSS